MRHNRGTLAVPLHTLHDNHGAFHLIAGINIASCDKAIQFRYLGIGADDCCENNMIKSQSGNFSLAHLMQKILCMCDVDSILKQHPAVSFAFHNKRNQFSHRVQIPHQKAIISVAMAASSSF